MPDASATRPARLGLGAKIFIAATLSVAGVLGVTLGLTSLQANRTADESIRRALAGVRRGVQAFLAGRTATFAGMSAVSAEVPQFRERLLKAAERSNVLDQAEEHRRLLGAAWVLITDEHGVLVARTDYPTESDIDLSPGALIAGALSGDETSGAWVDERRRKLFRSEEHTSELQSRLHLVCRLLLEKKKKRQRTTRARDPVSRRGPPYRSHQ